MRPYRIVLADDHVLVRQGLKRIIEDAGDLQVIGEAADGLELLGLLKRIVPDLIVLDISMPRLRGLETIHEVRATHAPPKILVLTMYKDKEYVFEAMAAGASGYLLKEEADTQLFSAIDRIRRGAIYVSPNLVGELTHDWAAARRPDQASAREPEPLTVREREILKLTAEGNTSKQIAEVLYISCRTVEHHRASIAVKLNMKGTADLVRYAIAKGYVSLNEPCPGCATPRRIPAATSPAGDRGPSA